MIDDLIEYAKSFLGTPYIYGGNNTLTGFDCSGYICEVLRAHGYLTLDFSAQGLYENFRFKLRSRLGRGSLLFFGKSREKISHVALSLNDLLMIEAGGGDETTLTLNESKRLGACVRVRPIGLRHDLIAVLKLENPNERADETIGKISA